MAQPAPAAEPESPAPTTEKVDVWQRTSMAAERTWLAWSRTALAAHPPALVPDASPVALSRSGLMPLKTPHGLSQPGTTQAWLIHPEPPFDLRPPSAAPWGLLKAVSSS